LPFFPDPRATTPTHYKDRPSDHPMPGFTTELSCIDGSTDALIFQPSVHLTLHWSVGPTCHIRRRTLLSIQILTRAVRLDRTVRRRRPSPPPATICARKLLRRPSAAPRARRRPPRLSTTLNRARRRRRTLVRVCPRRRNPAVRRRLGSPATTGGVRKAQILLPQPLLVVHSFAVVRTSPFPPSTALLGFLCTVS
jgi:hypothetical protein